MVTEQSDTPNGTVTRDGQIGEQFELAGMPNVLDGADNTELEFTGYEQFVQLSRCTGHEFTTRRQRHDPPIDRPIDRRAVDVADAPDLHSAPSTTVATSRARC